jgi:hypothetical protein
MKANDRYCRSDGCPQSLLRLASTARLDHLVVIFFFFFSPERDEVERLDGANYYYYSYLSIYIL